MRWHASLRRTGEIAFVRRTGRRSTGPLLTAHIARAREPGPWYVAVTVSKAVGNAVTRNRVKRRVKGALDAMVAPPSGARVVFVARPAAATSGYDALAREVTAAVGRSR